MSHLDEAIERRRQMGHWRYEVPIADIVNDAPREKVVELLKARLAAFASTIDRADRSIEGHENAEFWIDDFDNVEDTDSVLASFYSWADVTHTWVSGTLDEYAARWPRSAHLTRAREAEAAIRG